MSEEYEPGLVSVIVPTFNRASFLFITMNSVFQQTYRPVELLVIDDGSTDDTRQVVAKWESKYNDDDGFRLRYLFQENAGAQVARNLTVDGHLDLYHSGKESSLETWTFTLRYQLPLLYPIHP